MVIIKPIQLGHVLPLPPRFLNNNILCQRAQLKRIYLPKVKPPRLPRPNRWPPACGPRRSPSSSASSIFSAKENCCGGCCRHDVLAQSSSTGHRELGKQRS